MLIENKRNLAKIIGLPSGAFIWLYGIFAMVFHQNGLWVWGSIAGGLMALLSIFLYPNRSCIHCYKHLFLPWGAAHLWCSLWNFPVLAILGWVFYIINRSTSLFGWWRISERFSDFGLAIQSKVMKRSNHPTKRWVFWVIVQRFILVGPVLFLIIANYLLPPTFGWVTLLFVSHGFLICFVFLKSYHLMRDFTYSVVARRLFFAAAGLLPLITLKYYGYLYLPANA